MLKAPCKDCPDRYLGCHDHCDKFKEFRRNQDEFKRLRKEKIEAENAYYDVRNSRRKGYR